MTHSFDTDLAKRYGIECAVLLYNIDYWITKNKANQKHFYDGRYWTYNSIAAWQELFPYLTKDIIRKRIDFLVDEKVLIRGNFNKDRRDRTSWYTINFSLLQLAPEPNAVVEPANSSLYTDSKHTDTIEAVASPELFTANHIKKASGGLTAEYRDCVDIWLKQIHPGWAFGGQQGKAMKSLIVKIRGSCRAKGMIGDSLQVIEFFTIMCKNLPDWFKDKDLSIIDSKYNEIITQIENGGKTKERTTGDAGWIDKLYSQVPE